LCPQCAIVKPSGKAKKTPLHPIPVSRPFQIIGVNIMNYNNCHSKKQSGCGFPGLPDKVFQAPDQKKIHLCKIAG